MMRLWDLLPVCVIVSISEKCRYMLLFVLSDFQCFYQICIDNFLYAMKTLRLLVCLGIVLSSVLATSCAVRPPRPAAPPPMHHHEPPHHDRRGPKPPKPPKPPRGHKHKRGEVPPPPPHERHEGEAALHPGKGPHHEGEVPPPGPKDVKDAPKLH